MVNTDDDIRPLPEVEEVDTTVVWNDECRLGGKIPPMVVVKKGV
jgi:hypothetical protein